MSNFPLVARAAYNKPFTGKSPPSKPVPPPEPIASKEMLHELAELEKIVTLALRTGSPKRLRELTREINQTSISFSMRPTKVY